MIFLLLAVIKACDDTLVFKLEKERILSQQNDWTIFQMDDFNRMQYFITLNVGSNQQTMKFLIDTGSSVSQTIVTKLQVVWMAVQDCEECHTGKFDNG